MCDDMEAFEDLEDLEDKAEWFLPQVDGNVGSLFNSLLWNASEYIEMAYLPSGDFICLVTDLWL